MFNSSKGKCNVASSKTVPAPHFEVVSTSDYVVSVIISTDDFIGSFTVETMLEQIHCSSLLYQQLQLEFCRTPTTMNFSVDIQIVRFANS